MAEERISPYNQNDLKNTTDDALGNYLRGLRFQQDHSKLDVRLALGYASVVIAGVIFYADWKLGWQATKTWTAVAVLAYGALNAAFTYWMWAVEQGLVFEGSREGAKISILAKTKKHDPTYYLTVTTTLATTPGAKPVRKQLRAPFTTWFTADGFFVAKPFQQWLASGVDVIGSVDVKNAGKSESEVRPVVAVAAETETGTETLASSESGGATGADVQGKGSSKKGKRKA